jgi:hypothetical protein
MDVILMPDQMTLQIHESIGHPLELDRILGDERNFAGTSFVTLDMFGSYQYGSELLNVSYDPGVAHEFASFAFDDEGAPAERALLIERGRLLRPLGGRLSQSRARACGFELGAVATTRSAQRPATLPATSRAVAATTRARAVSGTAVKKAGKRKPVLLDLYSTAVGKKYAMAITGIIGIGFVVVHMIGNLKMYLGVVEENGVRDYDLDIYGEYLRQLLVPIMPEKATPWPIS